MRFPKTFPIPGPLLLVVAIFITVIVGIFRMNTIINARTASPYLTWGLVKQAVTLTHRPPRVRRDLRRLASGHLLTHRAAVRLAASISRERRRERAMHELRALHDYIVSHPAHEHSHEGNSQPATGSLY
jgi:hypothetical protein